MIVFDIDGTLADLSHRLHYITGEHKDWDAFHGAIIFKDEPIMPMIRLINCLFDDHSIVLLTGRSEKCRYYTEKWLEKWGIPYDELFMRVTDDRRPDYIVKKELLLSTFDPKDITTIFEDRKQVVEM